MQENILFEYLIIPSVTTDVMDLAVDVTNQGIIWWTKTLHTNFCMKMIVIRSVCVKKKMYNCKIFTSPSWAVIR